MQRIKKVILFIYCLIPGFAFSQQDSSGQDYKGIRFENNLSWSQIKSKAKVENKYIFVDCFTTWCGPCKLMDRNIYSSQRAGNAINKFYISVKVQMDSTSNDKAEVKQWYSDAHDIKEKYGIHAFPTFLFFSPEGVLVHSDLGAKQLTEFINLCELVRDPQKPVYYSLYTDYKQGKSDLTKLGELSIFTKNVIRDKDIAQNMSFEYKNKYLDGVDTVIQFTSENLLFIKNFPELVNSKDNVFQLCYNNPKKADVLTNNLGFSDRIVSSTIIKEEIENRILKNGKPLKEKPEWKKIQSKIAKKYVKIDAGQMVLDYKIKYYRFKWINWRLYTKYKDERIKLNVPLPPYDKNKQMMFLSGELNTFGAWDLFLYCSDSVSLKKGVEWIELALSFEPDNPYYLDTKANLLYKLNKREEALVLEKRAMDLSKENARGSFASYYQKMLAGKPTWPQLNN